jgi:hypothetical protein
MYGNHLPSFHEPPLGLAMRANAEAGLMGSPPMPAINRPFLFWQTENGK